MRNKVRKSLAFLLALALVVSVMSGLGLSVSAEQESNTPGTEEVQQQDKTEAGAAPSEVKAEEEAAKPEEKPVQEEKEDEQKTEARENADKPAEKQEKATPKAGENVQTATIGTGDKTVTVKTTAAAGVLPEGAKLVVKKLADKDQAYQDAESTLKDSQVTYDDFLALDVGFEVNGKEVEPEAGSVQVQFELGAGLLPETADTNTLAVQHLTDGKAETVADAGAVTAGDVTVNSQVIKADFEVKSFSSFTITWSSKYATYFRVTVKFVSDGDPTYYYDDKGYTVGNGGSYDAAAMTKAQDVVKQMSANMFFTVGVGPRDNYSKLKNLTDSVKSGVTTKNYDGDNNNTLKKAFDDITAQITTFLCTNVIVTDVLSENVQMVMGSNDEPKKLVVTVTDKDGNAVQMPEGIITVGYDKTAKKIFMDFKDDYELDPNYTYTVTATIKATEKAYENYRNNGNKYTVTGDTDTGTTSAGKAGVFSNKDGEAMVTYTYNKKPGKAEYPRPVIQLHPGTLIVKKQIQGDLTEQEKTALVNKMTVDVTINGKKDNVPLRDFTRGVDGTYTMTIEGLTPGTPYSVTESGADVEGYEWTTTPSKLPVSGSVDRDEKETVSITNNYTRAVQNLTITKAVSGEDDAFDLDVRNINYTFTITPGEGVTVKDGTYGAATFSKNVGTVTIKGKNSVTIPGLPVGTYTVTENSGSDVPEGYDFDTNSTEMSGTATLTNKDAGSVTITNKYKIKTFNVTVKKEVTGNMSDPKDEFKFKVNGGEDQPVTAEEGKNTIATEVPYGSSFTVTESDKGGYTLDKIEATGSTGRKSDDTYTIEKVTEDTAITFTNEKTIQPPNGITTTIAPYAIMVVLAAGAGVYFAYSRRRRNR